MFVLVPDEVIPAVFRAEIAPSLRPSAAVVFASGYCLGWRQMPENDWATLPIAAVEPMLKAPLQRPDPDAPGPYAFSDPEKVERILRDSGWRDIALARRNGALGVGGGGAIGDIADFLLKIGPCARAIADQGLIQSKLDNA